MLRHLLGREELWVLDAPRLGVFDAPLEERHSLLAAGHLDATRLVVRLLAVSALQLGVEPATVVGELAQRFGFRRLEHDARCVRRRPARCRHRALVHDHHVLTPHLRQLVREIAADDTSADDDRIGLSRHAIGCFHRSDSNWLWRADITIACLDGGPQPFR